MKRELDATVIERHLERLRRMRDGGKTIPTFAVDRAAELFGVSRRTIWRWVAEGTPTPKEARPLTEEEIGLYYDMRGNVTNVHRAVAGRDNASARRTLANRFNKQLSLEERRYVRHGANGARSAGLYLRWEAEYRNQLWESDHKELPILVLPRRGWKPVKPWVTVIEDAKTRAVVGAALVPRRPTRAEVLSALRAAVLVFAERGPFGGRPDVLVWDNGLEFTANDVDQLALELGCDVAPTPAYTPTAKGKIERLNRTLEQELISTLPNFTDGPRAANGKLYGPKNVEPMTCEAFAKIFFDYVWHYNNERPHSALGGRTPLEAWRDDPTPIREVDPSEVRRMMPSVSRKIFTDGIHHSNDTFWSPKFHGLVGERVDVRYMPFDNREIEVFRNDEWLATAVPVERVNAETRVRHVQIRREERKRMATRMRSSSRRSAARLIALTEPGAVEDGDPLAAAEEKRVAKRHKPDPAVMKLLGIYDDMEEALDQENSEGEAVTGQFEGEEAA